MEEKWVNFPVPNDWKHGYAVSNFGRVRKNGRHWANHKLINIQWDAKGPRLRLFAGEQRLSFNLPELVRKYHTNIPRGKVEYIDGNPGNFKASNMKKKDSRRKLTVEQVKYIKYRVATGQSSMTSLAKEHGVSLYTIQQIIYGLTYKDVIVHVGDMDGII
jgi:hypothetical protein